MRAHELVTVEANSDAKRLTEALLLPQGYYITQPGKPAKELSAAEFGHYYVGERDLKNGEWLYRIRIQDDIRSVTVMIDTQMQFEFKVAGDKIIEYEIVPLSEGMPEYLSENRNTAIKGFRTSSKSYSFDENNRLQDPKTFCLFVSPKNAEILRLAIWDYYVRVIWAKPTNDHRLVSKISWDKNSKFQAPADLEPVIYLKNRRSRLFLKDVKINPEPGLVPVFVNDDYRVVNVSKSRILNINLDL